MMNVFPSEYVEMIFHTKTKMIRICCFFADHVILISIQPQVVSDTCEHQVFLTSYLLVRSLMTFQSRGKMLSFIRFLNTHKIFNKNSWRQTKCEEEEEEECE